MIGKTAIGLAWDRRPRSGQEGILKLSAVRGAARLLAGAAGLAALMLAALAQPAAAQFQAPDIAVNEGEVAVFKVTLPRTYEFAVRFAYRTQDGSARKGRHYVAQQGHLVFPAGTRSGQVQVRTRANPDGVTRDFRLVLSDRQIFASGSHGWGGWSAAWATIYARDVPDSRTIRAEIRDTFRGATGPE